MSRPVLSISASVSILGRLFFFASPASADAAPAAAPTVITAATSPSPKLVATPDPYATLKISNGKKSLKQAASAEIEDASSDTRDLDANLRLAEKISSRRRSGKQTANLADKKKSARELKSRDRKKEQDGPIGDTATTELTVDKADQSRGILPTPGTVRSSVSAVNDPVSRAAFEASVAFQSYKPAGIMRLPSMDPFDLSTAPAGPMLALEIRWFPFHFDTAQPLALGPLLSVGYGQLPLKLYTPSGSAISRTELHLLKAEAGASLGWQPSALSRWGARLELGAGQMTETQASTSSYANHSASLIFSSAGLYGEYNPWPHLSVFAGYSYRLPVTREPEEFILQRNNFLAGITGGFD